MKKINLNLKEKLKKLRWGRLDEFERYFIRILLIFLLIGITAYIFELSFLSNFLNSQQEWISRTFSVPVVNEEPFSIDSQDILFILLVLIAAIIAGILKGIKSRI